MLRRNSWLGAAALAALLIGMLAVGCEDPVPEELNGMWKGNSGMDNIECIVVFNNGRFEQWLLLNGKTILKEQKGTYKISGGRFTMTTTHIHGDMFTGLDAIAGAVSGGMVPMVGMSYLIGRVYGGMESKWYKKTELKTAVKRSFEAYFTRESGEVLTQSERAAFDASFDESYGRLFDMMFLTVSGPTYRVTGGKLILTYNGDQTIYVKYGE